MKELVTSENIIEMMRRVKEMYEEIEGMLREIMRTKEEKSRERVSSSRM